MIEAQFDGAGSFSQGRAWVQIDDQYGYINRSGDVVVALQYEAALDFNAGLAAVMRDGSKGRVAGTVWSD